MSSDQLNFSKPTNQEWLQKIEADLKGKPIESLRSQTRSGIPIEPLYSRESISDNLGTPGQAPYTHGSKRDGNPWFVNQEIQVDAGKEKEANKKALQILNAGVDSLSYVGNWTNLESLVKDINIQYIEFNITCESKVQFEQITKWLSEKAIENWNGCIFSSNEYTLPLAKEIQQNPLLKTHVICGSNYHNKGANSISELACVLSEAHEQLLLLLENNIPLDSATAKVAVELASGPDYFEEMAKFRAIRILWSTIVAEYKPEYNCSHSVWIKGTTSSFHQAKTDLNTNLLRSTTQAMSAILGGANTVEVKAFNSVDESNEFGERIARNVQLLAKEESLFDKVSDPAAGSYYIDHLTEQIVERAWKLFQSIEKQGGWMQATRNGFIEHLLQNDLKKQIDQLNSGETTMIGVNAFINNQENSPSSKQGEHLVNFYDAKKEAK